ncbi:MAG: DEAD/DEAH box helicase [Hyphomicrobium sp.]
MTFPATHPSLARSLEARGYTVATAVQSAVLEASAANRDLLVSAQTGSGKTVAFGLAMASTLLGEAERFERADAPLALIIAPTRELALQVHRELDWLYANTGARIVTCVGGMDARAEARQLSSGAHIVVGTPGRLRDHLERRRLDLSTLKAIVLDEADEMLDLGFREDLEFILDKTPEGRQSLLFSATMPKEIEALARRYQRDAIRIETLRRDEQHADIEYSAIRVVPNDVENAVVNVLRYHEMRATLVFCSTREAVRRLHARLVERGFSAVALSGELTQHERTTALQALRDGRARVLVATDVAARGLDLPDLALVIHADLPNDRETLLHRSGRTGRAGRKGLCVLIVPFNRRRKAETLLGAARLKVTWGTAPTAEEIRARDSERFLADPVFTDAASDEDLVQARAVQAARSADEIALALVRMNRAQLPAPEDLAEDTGPPARRETFARNGSDRDFPARERAPRDRERYDRKPDADAFNVSSERGPRSKKPRPEDNREMVWFRLNIGRERNADPRWLLPLICRAGGVTKAEIGSIKIFDRDTRFQIAADFADQFDLSLKSNKPKEGHIARVGAHLPADTVPSGEPVTPYAKPHTRSPKPPPASHAPTHHAKPPHSKAPWKARDKDKQGDRPTDRPDAKSADKFGAPLFRKPGADDARGDRKSFKKPYHGKDGGKPHFRAGDAGSAKPDGKFAAKKKHRKGPSAPA